MKRAKLSLSIVLNKALEPIVEENYRVILADDNTNKARKNNNKMNITKLINMKNSFCLLLLLFLFTSTKAQLKIGEKLNPGIKVVSTLNLMTNSASFETASKVVLNGISYNITFNKDETVKAIFTFDKSFSTEENIKIGMSYAEIKNQLDDKSGRLDPGWARYYSSKSGWKVAFDFNSTVTDSSKVQFIFKKTEY